ncbi:hypothetical protein GQ53DRAFT_774530 [Thozetella sp. PMI_491]|nr:hypothetical protein GQ53DRAFT_774530 [Thozetella sp. PMI_491]
MEPQQLRSKCEKLDSQVELMVILFKIIEGSYGIFYQSSIGQLAQFIPVSSFPSITLPGSALFALARFMDETIDKVNTYLLYQDKTSKIKQVWTDDAMLLRYSLMGRIGSN